MKTYCTNNLLATAATAAAVLSVGFCGLANAQVVPGSKMATKVATKGSDYKLSVAAISQPVRQGPTTIGTCDTIQTDFEEFTPGPISGQFGWTVFDASGPNFPIISDENPNSGSQHLRNIRNTGVAAGNFNGAFSPNCLPGNHSFSVDVYISTTDGPDGADYEVVGQAPTQGFLTVRLRFDWQGNIFVLDDQGGGLQFFDTGVQWIAGQYVPLEIEMNPGLNTINYTYDGNLIYTGAIFAGTIFEQIILFSDNWHNPGESGDFDNLSMPAGGIAPTTCLGDLNDDGFVNVSDLLLLFGAWGECPGCAADFNDDGFVNVSDLLLLFGAWGECPAPPTPTGACCFADFTCVADQTSAECSKLGGTYGGNNTTCANCPQPPSGNTCGDALPVGPTDTIVVDTTGNPNASSPSCGGLIPTEPTAWLVVEGTGTTLTVATDTGMTGPGSSVIVYCSSCATPICVGGATGNAGPQFEDGEVSWCSQAGELYYIAVWRNLNFPGEVTVSLSDDGTGCTPDVTCDLSPANNDCVDAIDITGNIDGADVLGNNEFADNGDHPANSPSCQWQGNPANATNTVWYSFVADGVNAYNINTCGSALPFQDTVVALYSGSCGSLVEVGCGGDDCPAPDTPPYYSEILTGALSAGTYYVAVSNNGGWAGSTPGNFVLRISTIAPPGPGACCFSDQTCSDLLQVDCNSLGGFFQGEGTECSTTTCPSGEENDLCVDAIPVTCGSTTIGTTIGATFDDVGDCNAVTNTTAGVWYSFIGTGETVNINTCSAVSDYDTKISVFTGTCGSLVCVTANDDSLCTFGNLLSSVTFESVLDQEYLILVHGWADNIGNFGLNVVCGGGGGGDESCAGNCGDGSGEPGCFDAVTCDCYCDELCAGFGDCCNDVCDECPALSHCSGSSPSCAGNCNGGTGEPGCFDAVTCDCYCDELCAGFGDCCDDVCDECPALSHCP